MYVGNFAALAFVFGATAAQATTTVAVIDSGVDYKHIQLSPRMWTSGAEIAGNQKDDDGNGFVDDVRGWNFAEGNADVIDYKHLGTFPDDCYEFFAIQGKILRGTATEADKAWLAEKRADQAFLSKLMTFGNFVHGSHVAGISTASRSIEQIIAVKIIPTETPGLGEADLQAFKEKLGDLDKSDPLTDLLVQWMLNSMIDQQVKVIVDAFDYAVAQKADVVNGSFGVSYASASQSVKALLSLFGQEPSEEDVKKHTRYLIDTMNERCKEAIDKAADKTLFVFAAANDGTDNDDVNVSPGGVKADNVVSVAATMDFDSLASFSNYGATAVDVAAPGVAVNSTVPGDKMLEMSGTSMASPYVAQVAALVKDANPALKPAETKQIIVGTVDVKDWLQGKVKSGGVVNLKRAVEAARLSRSVAIPQAIAQALESVADARSGRKLEAKAGEVFVTPLPSPIFQ